MAIQWVRVPAFRPTVLGIADSIYRSWFSKALSSKESWSAALADAGLPADSPGADYDKMLEYLRSGEYSLSAENEWYLQRGFLASDTMITKSLRTRHWGTIISNNGSFIASDNPVALDGPKGRSVGFRNADVVIFPVSRHVLLYGTRVPVRPSNSDRKLIAGHNTFAMLTAEEQVYSHKPEFCWLDESNKCQTDWRRFRRRSLSND